MNDGMTLDKLSTLAETVDLECKAAQGRDGRGELPEDFWKRYWAFPSSNDPRQAYTTHSEIE